MLPPSASGRFVLLSENYFKTQIEFPQLRAVTLAQWAKESGWGNSDLARTSRNYAGMKWREYMEEYGAIPTRYKAWDGWDLYAAFPDDDGFIKAYWRRLDTISAYAGWRDNTDTPAKFMNKIGPTWVGGTKEDGKKYVKDVLTIARTRIVPQFKIWGDKA